jgi:adenosylmethionine-8-amino-7-oxononanoate aminotransferase
MARGASTASISSLVGPRPSKQGDIRGRGLFRALEIVSDRTRKTPFDPGRGINTKIKNAAIDEGLLCYPMGGTVDGRAGDHVLLAPPFIVSDDQIGELVDKLSRAVRRVLGASSTPVHYAGSWRRRPPASYPN